MNCRHKEFSTRQQADWHRKTGPIIGRGSYGIVYVSGGPDFQTNGEERYAVKVLRESHVNKVKKGRKSLVAEHCILSALQHQSIIQSFCVEIDPQGNMFHIMELCTGGDLLHSILEAGTFEETKANHLFAQLVSGVEHLHQCGVAHRDLKPENILLTSSSTLKIADFGLAECFRLPWEGGAHKTRGIRGTKAYLAPEVFTTTWFDPRAVDVWACGVVYLAMRLGKLLWLQALPELDGDYTSVQDDRRCCEGVFRSEFFDSVGFCIGLLKRTKLILIPKGSSLLDI